MSAATTLPLGAPKPLSPDVSYATGKGLTLEQVGNLWEGHVKGSQSRGFDSFGGTPWRRYVDAAVERMNEDGKRAAAPVTSQGKALAARKLAEDRAKEEADAIYDRERIGVVPYLGSLLTRGHLTAAEHLLLFAGMPGPGETVWDFFNRAFSKASVRAYGEAAERDGLDPLGPIRRAHRCPCGQDVSSSLYEGRRYYGSRCAWCRRKERDESEERRIAAERQTTE